MSQSRQAWLSNLLRSCKKPMPQIPKQKKSLRGQCYLWPGIKPAVDLSKAERLQQRREWLAEQQ